MIKLVIFSCFSNDLNLFITFDELIYVTFLLDDMILSIFILCLNELCCNQHLLNGIFHVLGLVVYLALFNWVCIQSMVLQ